jgi:hypothetical protein
VGLDVLSRKPHLYDLDCCVAVHPVLVAFPTKFPDGSPVIKSIDNPIELHTTVDGRRAVIKLTPAHLGAKSVDDLKLR